MPLQNSTIGYDSIQSNVDEFELIDHSEHDLDPADRSEFTLQERHFDVVDSMARPVVDFPSSDRLDDIARLITRARRDSKALRCIADYYAMDLDADGATHRIARQTLDTVRHIVNHR